MTNFVWTVTQIEVINEDGLQNVIVTTCFTVTGDENGLIGAAQGDTKLLPPDAQHFINFQDVTEAEAVQWTKDALGEDRVAVYELLVQQQIDAQKVAQPEVVPLPWASGAS